MEQIIIRFYNDKSGIGIAGWKTVYQLKPKITSLIPEVYKGKLIYRSKGSSKRYSYASIKKGLVKKQMIINIQLPF